MSERADGPPVAAGSASPSDPQPAERLQVGWLSGEVVEPVLAATVMLLRDGVAGLEVLMLERHLRSEFAAGAYAFPGGKVEDADRQLPADRWRGIDPAHAAAELGVTDAAEALGLYVAAVRETFEEAGVLFARRADGSLPDAASVAEARQRLTDRQRAWDWTGWLRDEGLVLDLGALAFWSWWVTPKGVHRRYDTRFFVARLPAGGRVAHDEVETTAARWITPQAALDAQRAGEVTIVYPTRKNLEALAGYPTAEAAWRAAAEGRTDRRRIEPEVVIVDGVPMVRHPDGGDPEPG